MKKLCEGIYGSNAPIDNSQSRRSKFPDEFVSDLIVQNMHLISQNENMFSYEMINRRLLKNFTYYLNSIFINPGDNYSVSFIHEHLEDIYLRIYTYYLKKMFKNKQMTSKHDLWEITGAELTESDIDVITQDLLSNNLVELYLKNFGVQRSSVNKLKEIMFNTFKMHFKNEEQRFSDELFKNGDKLTQVLNSKIEKEREQSFQLLREIVKLTRNFITSGKVTYNDQIIYNFKKFYIEYLNLEKQNFETCFNFINNLDSQDTIDHFINSIKYKQNPLKSLFISSNINGKISFPLSKLIQMIILHNSELKYFTLTESSLSYNQVHALAKLISFSQLEVIDLSNNKLGDSNIKIISDAMKHNQSIKIIYLSNNNLTSVGGSYLGEFLLRNHSVEKINLGGNKINDYGLHSLVNAIATNGCLKQFDISDNKLTHNDMIYISNHLISKTQSIEVLNLSYNRFDPESVNVFGLCLKNNSSIKIIYLNSVSFNEDSSPYFFQHLAGTKLSEIYLDNNYLGEIGGILFANVLKNNINIKIVSMKKCELNSMSLHCIAKALEVNETLRTLNLEENRFDDNSLFNLKAISDKRQIKISLSTSCLTTRSCDIIRQSSNFIIY